MRCAPTPSSLVVQQIEQCTCAGEIAGTDRELRSDADGSAALIGVEAETSRRFASSFVARCVIFATFDDASHRRITRFDSRRLHKCSE